MGILNQLVNSLCCLPGVGPRSAQRMVDYLLRHQRHKGLDIAKYLQAAMQSIVQCKRCNNYSEQDLCTLCQTPERDFSLLCIVENPADVLAIEQSGAFKGGYFVLMGKISPLDGVGPEEIALPRLQELVLSTGIKEIIIALSPSIEGQTTSYFIQDLFRESTILISHLARGIPSGGELEFLDGITISNALNHRVAIHE